MSIPFTSFVLFSLLISCTHSTETTKINGSSSLTKEVDSDSLLTLEEHPDTIPPLNEDCLPLPSDQFRTLKKNNQIYNFFEPKAKGYTTEEVYLYLALSLDSIDSKKTVKWDDDYGPVIWEQKFARGITYRYEMIEEVGADGTLITKCTDKQQFLKAIIPVIDFVGCEDCYDPEQVWSKDSTSYEPEDGGAGCYYSIDKDSTGFYRMDWYCGC